MLRRNLLVPPFKGALPVEAVEHGWFPCMTEGQLCFAYQCQRKGSAMSPANIPNLFGSGHRLWRKGQTTFDQEITNKKNDLMTTH